MRPSARIALVTGVSEADIKEWHPVVNMMAIEVKLYNHRKIVVSAMRLFYA